MVKGSFAAPRNVPSWRSKGRSGRGFGRTEVAHARLGTGAGAPPQAAAQANQDSHVGDRGARPAPWCVGQGVAPPSPAKGPKAEHVLASGRWGSEGRGGWGRGRRGGRGCMVRGTPLSNLCFNFLPGHVRVNTRVDDSDRQA